MEKCRLCMLRGVGGMTSPAAWRRAAARLPGVQRRSIAHGGVAPPPPSSRMLGDAAASAPAAPADERFMRLAVQQAAAASALGEVPVGAVLVVGEEVLAACHNRVHTSGSPLAHAELLCIQQAAQQMQGWRLLDATLYVTLEPCPMCAGAILQSRLKRLVYGARQPRLGADGSWVSLFPRGSPGVCVGPNHVPSASGRRSGDTAAAGMGSSSSSSSSSSSRGGSYGSEVDEGSCPGPTTPHPFHPDIAVTRGVLAAECGAVMVDFFRRRRREQEQDHDEQRRQQQQQQQQRQQPQQQPQPQEKEEEELATPAHQPPCLHL